MGFVIRKAEPGEEDRILPMYEWLFMPPGSQPPRWDSEKARARLGEAIRASQSVVLVVEEGEDLIAFCTVYLELNSVRFGQRCWVEDFAVDPQQRSRGVGSELLNAVRQWADSAGATHLELDSGLARVDAHRFYEREGGARQSYTFGWEL